jgi:hypothetical protein
LFGQSRLLIEREENLLALNARLFYLIDVRDSARQRAPLFLSSCTIFSRDI